MPIEFACESCKKLLRVPDGSGGLSCECPACFTLLEIPDPDAVKVVEAAGKQGSSADSLCIACPKCAHELVCSTKLLGTKGQCKNCKYIFTIAKGGGSKKAEEASSGLVFTCPQCEQLFEGREEMRGRKGKCHACGEVFPIQLRPAEGPATPKKPVPKTLKRAPAPHKKPQPSAASKSPAPKKQPTSVAPPIQFTCTSCNGVMQVPAAAAGQTTSCPYCQQLQQIPAQGAPQTKVAPQAAHQDSPFSQPMATGPLDNWADLGDLSGGATNPYAAPAMSSYSAPAAAPSKSRTRRSRRPADLGKRLLGAIVDGIASFVFVVPGYAVMLSSTTGNPNEPPPLFFVGLGVLILGALVLFVVQIYLLATRSQTIGKFVVKTQIVDADTYRPAGLVSTVLMRSIVNGIIGSIPCIGPIYSLVDICFIFREDHRCVHDLLANTIVVDIS